MATRTLSVLVMVAVASTPAFGAGFSIFEQGAKAMGTAGAFTGQADDPSALFHNVGGLAFFDEQEVQVGVTLINVLESDMTGLDPFPGEGVTEEVDAGLFTPPHVYWVRPINDRLNFGFHFNTPFGLAVEWENPESFTGRFISTNAELRSFDFGANLGYQINDNFGVGFGAIVRASDVGLERFAPVFNPFNQTVQNAALIDLDGDISTGVGFQIGFLHKVGAAFSWGASYRSAIEVDYDGDGRLTQQPTGNAQVDAIVAANLPFDVDLPIETTIEFPDMASVGISVALTQRTRLNVDANWTGWSTFDRLPITFTTAPQLSSLVAQEWDDAYNYRIGFSYQSNSGRTWRFGYVHDESPQPEESVGPILPDSDRDGFTVGLGTKKWDFALMYLLFDERISETNSDAFFGRYNTEVVLLGGTYSF